MLVLLILRRNKIHTQETEDLNHVMLARLEKLKKIKELGVDPFPHSCERTHSAAKVLSDFDNLRDNETTISLTGRLISLRLMGKAAFAHIQDEDTKIQIYVKRDNVGQETWQLFKLLDIGDIVGVTGRLFITRTEERTLEVSDFMLLAKNLRPLPSTKEKDGQRWHEWSDKDEKYRHRNIDLIVNPETRKVFQQRSFIISEIRKYFDEQMGFIEVETPVLQPLYGGAAARPFVTHHHALDRQLYLRIADELYLKRLITGGFNRVYEIAKDFRNEGLDRFHSPEFTMLECYASYEDYYFSMTLLEELLPSLAMKLHGSTTLEWEGNSIDLSTPFQRMQMVDLARDKTGIEIVNRNRDDLAHEIKQLGINIEPEWGTGKLIDELFSEKIEPELIQPTFVIDYPVELSPLAKKHRTEDGLVERFELFIGGHEIANSFTELNDPIDQRQRFEEQARLRAAGDDEATPVDEDFLQSLEVGMPPTTGLGVGIDRLVMLLTGCDSIRDVILFPTLRDKN
ncbi:MAG: lysine--tRNA ligase [Calditrichaeota bacterium]|nr:lysine--tRNA ligase [Calditrichota bacterium]